MTEFEQQVAAALQAGAPSLALEDYWNVLDRLAPRVAAAIEWAAGAEASNASAPSTQVRDWRQEALSALRGETP